MNIWSSCSPNIEIRKRDERMGTALDTEQCAVTQVERTYFEVANAVKNRTESCCVGLRHELKPQNHKSIIGE